MNYIDEIVDYLIEIKGLHQLCDILVDCNKSEFLALCGIIQYEKENNVAYANVSSLAKKYNVSLPAISKVLRPLEGKKYINKHTDVLCRRNTQVSVSSLGEKVINNNLERINKVFELSFGSDFFKVINEMKKCSKKISDSVEFVLKGDNGQC